jgi:hypothetical protein
VKRRAIAVGTRKARKPSIEQRIAGLLRELTVHARDIPDCSIEELWKSHYGLMKRLVSLDLEAITLLRRKLQQVKPKPVDSRRLVCIRRQTRKSYDQPSCQRGRLECYSAQSTRLSGNATSAGRVRGVQLALLCPADFMGQVDAQACCDQRDQSPIRSGISSLPRTDGFFSGC